MSLQYLPVKRYSNGQKFDSPGELLRPWANFFLHQSIELNKTSNFYAICVEKKYLQVKSFEWKCLKIFSSIFGSRRGLSTFDTHNWNQNCRDNYILSINTENFSFLSPTVMEKKSGQRGPLTTRKLAISQIFIIIYQSWKFHRNLLNSFREFRWKE